MTAVLLILAALSACAASVIAGYENGVYALSHIRLRYRLSIGDPKARIVERLLAHPQRLLTTLLISLNMVVYLTTAIVTGVLESMGVVWAETVATFGLAVFFFIFVEAIPKNIFRRAADTLVYVFARPVAWLTVALWPVELVMRGITGLVRRIGAGETDVFNPFFTRERLAFYLREGQTGGVLSQYQVQLTSNILRGERATVARAMVPLDKAALVPAEATREEFLALARDKRFSRYPVYKGARERIVGIVNIYDCPPPGGCAGKIEDIMRPVYFFPGDLHATESLRRMREARTPMGIVGDGTRALGLVTMKDCIEEIVGELYAW